MVVLSPNRTKHIQQNGRFHWEFGMHQRDALKRVVLNTYMSCMPLHKYCICTCTWMAIHSFALSRVDSLLYTLHSLMLLTNSYAHSHSPKPKYGCRTVTCMHTWQCIAIFSFFTHNIADTSQMCFAREMPCRMRMERNTAGKRRTMKLKRERSLAERQSAVEGE